MNSKKEIAVIVIHGIGRTKKTYADDIEARLRKKINAMGGDWDRDVTFHSVYYQGVLQGYQDNYMGKTGGQLGANLWNGLRRFLISSFGDAGTLEASRTLKNGAYEKAQGVIFETLKTARGALKNPKSPVIFVAHSLGCQVLSSYIWDADKWSATQPLRHGHWRHKFENENSEEIDFLRLNTLKILITTGCNIPIFLCGLPRDKIQPIQRAPDALVWENYYSANDVLGWPLKSLSDKNDFKGGIVSYDDLVIDKKIAVGHIFARWNPLSHNYYWKSPKVIGAICRYILKHIK